MAKELVLDLTRVGSRHLACFYKKVPSIRELVKDEDLAVEVQLRWLNLCAEESQESRDLLRDFLEEKKKELDGCYQTVKELFGL